MKFMNFVGFLSLFELEDGVGRGWFCLNVIVDICML